MDKEPIELKLCGIFNIIFGLITVVIYFFPFILGVLLGWVTDREFYGKLDWFILVIADRFIFAVTYIFSFLLIRSGILILKIDSRGRKLSIISLIVVVIGTALNFLTAFIREIAYQRTGVDFFSPLSFLYYIFYIYVFVSIVYLTGSEMKRIFNDENIRVRFFWPIFAIGLSFISPFFIWYVIDAVLFVISKLTGRG